MDNVEKNGKRKISFRISNPFKTIRVKGVRLAVSTLVWHLFSSLLVFILGRGYARLNLYISWLL